MGAEILNSNANVVTARITGRLTQTDLSSLQQNVIEMIEQHGSVRLLVILENFAGWQQGGDWGDLSFHLQHDGQIEKMALLGDRKWKELALTFAAKGIRKFPIEYFGPAEKGKALAWLAETAAQSETRS